MARRFPRWATASLVALTVGLGAAPPAQAATRHGPPRLPDTYVVSEEPGVVPEGVAVHRDGRMYVSSDATGGLFAGDVRMPAMHPFAVGTVDRPSSRGVHTERSGRVWSVGAGTLTVHSRNGRLLATRGAPDGPLGAADLNDLALTRDAVYVTDWANPIVYRAAIRHGRPGPLQPWVDIRSAFPQFPAQYWLLNGIVADAAGDTVLVASNGTEAVWRIDVATRAVEQVDLGGHSFGADGMVLAGRRLYAVLNYGAPNGVYVADLDPELRSGTVTHQILTDADGQAFDLPTTLARYRCRLYVVNSQGDHRPGQPPYTVSAVADPACGE
ncbi:hypothetical protein SAMN05421678_114184 [Actinopolymorpha cephalotaxi]|uniref:DNA-binding beta-propeller fold protein YncE n=1 Tax=Actinopolymorpha cephalotaxi TaxID=504797 RepID=A0A1I2YQA9_9ACTN|nr:hypothetical protein [Actinopolymorpha cephalotaxi]NYH86882.1 DNA-binding beta-propeller fold protein YncE [Actinopolymorpha cephalotaxi]SFH26831.1 hypothetical protein SAMN05421678_114184 [Actinopolymorpha cephalotaxi]